MEKTSIDSARSDVTVVRTAPLLPSDSSAIHDRDLKTGRFDANAYRRAHVQVTGAGGLGGFICLGLARKGVGKITICDGDTVDASNLNRQRFQFSSIGKPKSSELARQMASECTAESVIHGIDLYFEEAIQEGLVDIPNLSICAPDNDEVREFQARYCLKHRVPLIVLGLSDDSDYGYISVQLPDSEAGCWRCAHKASGGKAKCGVAANINLPMLMAGITLSVCDALISMRNLTWHFRRLSLSGLLPDATIAVPKWPDCPLCGRCSESNRNKNIEEEWK